MSVLRSEVGSKKGGSMTNMVTMEIEQLKEQVSINLFLLPSLAVWLHLLIPN